MTEPSKTCPTRTEHDGRLRDVERHQATLYARIDGHERLCAERQAMILQQLQEGKARGLRAEVWVIAILAAVLAGGGLEVADVLGVLP